MRLFIAKLFQVFSHWSLESQSQFRFQSTWTHGQPASQPDKQTWLWRSHHDLKKEKKEEEKNKNVVFSGH